MNDLNHEFYIKQPLAHITAYAKAGKTSLATSLTIDALVFCQKKVLYFSPGKEKACDIRYRMVAAWKEWPLADIQYIMENPADKRHPTGHDSMGASFKLPLIIRDEENISFEQLRKWCLWHARKDQIDLIVVDDFHLIQGVEKMANLHELQKMVTMLQIPCLVFTPLPRVTDRNLRCLSRLNIRIGTCSNLSFWLDRPQYEVEARLEITKAIGRGVTKETIPLSFNPHSAHFEDLENIGIHMTMADLKQGVIFNSKSN